MVVKAELPEWLPRLCDGNRRGRRRRRENNEGECEGERTMKAKAKARGANTKAREANAKARDSECDDTRRVRGVHLGFVGEVSEIVELHGEGQGMSLDT